MDIEPNDAVEPSDHERTAGMIDDHASPDAQAPDELADEALDDATVAPSRFDGWRRRSAIGGLATGVALGLQEVFSPNKNEPVISAEAPGEPPDAGERMQVLLDPDDPTKSIVVWPSARPDEGDAPPPGPARKDG